MPQTWGVPVEEIARGIRHGVRKVNIDTDCRLAMTAAFRKVATQSKSEFDPRKFLKPAMDAMRDLCRERFEQFGTAGNAVKDQGDPAGGNGQALSLGQPRSADRLAWPTRQNDMNIFSNSRSCAVINARRTP